MDIRNWFTSPKSNSTEKAKNSSKTEKQKNVSKTPPKEEKQKKAKPSKKRKIISDSDSEDEPPVKKESPPKTKKSSNSVKQKKRVYSSDEDNIIECDSDASSQKVVSNAKKPSLRHNRTAVAHVEKPKLKLASISDFFGSAPVERSFKTPKANKKEANSSLEVNHENDDFQKTLLQLEETSHNKPLEIKKEKRNETTKPKAEKIRKHLSSDIEIDPSPDFIPETPPTGSTDKKETKKGSVDSVRKKKKSKTLSSDIEFEPSPNSIAPKKVVIKVSPPSTKEKKKRGNSANYMSYLNRDGPRSLGSKEIPEGEEACLEGLAFVVTGILESITREETSDLIEKHGGKLMNTLSKKTNYLIFGRDSGPKKIEKAESFGTIQIDEDGLFDLVRNTPGKGPKKEKKKSPIKVEEEKKKSPIKVKEEGKVDGVKVSSNKTSNLDNLSSPDKSNKLTGDNHFRKEFPKSPLKDHPSPSHDHTTDRAKTGHAVQMWVDKYKPSSLKQVIGQQGDASNAKKLSKWLQNWSGNNKGKKAVTSAGRWNSNTDGSSFKAALLSGPPGVGKTTTAQLVCKEVGFDFIELNASDTRSKKSLQNTIFELLKNQSLSGCFKEGINGNVSKNHVVIMDEVDGMAGNEDRGGIQELIGFIKSSKIPIICICNDRNHQKIRSLSNHCFDLRFSRPRVEQIKAAMMSIAFKEGIKVTPNVLQDVIIGSNQDIRQVLHNLSMWCAKEKGLSAEQAKADIGYGTKHIKMGPFDVLREVFTVGQNPKTTINDKASLFFHDYSVGPLFVQENYVHVVPKAAGNDRIKHLQLLSECADSICVGDLINKQIRSQGNWNLLPVQAIFSSVVPGDLMVGQLKQMINFPAWLGKNSNRNHMDRILQELQMHMRMRTTGNKTEVALDYLPLLRSALTAPLLEREAEGVKDVLKIMEYYYLLREDFDNVIELSLWSNQTDPRSKISAKVKSAFTRAYNKECTQNPYAVSSVSKKKKSSIKDSQSELLGEEGAAVSEEDSGDDDKIENDAMIKMKKPSKAASTGDKPTTSKKGNKAKKAPSK